MKIEKDQHFLIDQDILALEIRTAELNSKDKVIEIGSGKGILTKELIKSKVLAFEINQLFKKDMDKLKSKNLKVIYDNALNYSWKGYTKIVSNIPYTISEPIILKAIEDKIPFLVLIVSESFKELLIKAETKIGIITNLFYNVESISFVKRECFEPKPSVDSYLIKLTAKESNDILKEIVLKEGKIKNAILYSLVSRGKTKKQSKEIIQKLNIPEKVLNKSVKKITGDFLLKLRSRFINLSL
jgi:16S rRNA (adenine1518-N6/adenine1519-N6)-dimethyltransferase